MRRAEAPKPPAVGSPDEAASTPRRAGGGPRSLAAVISGVVAPALRRRGFAQAGVVTEWTAIVGGALAANSYPVHLKFAPGRADGGTLLLRASGPTALELQHLEPVIIERINTYFGYKAVERLRILQAPPQRRPRARPPRQPLSPGAAEALADRLRGVTEPEVRAALARLGRAIGEGH